MSALPVADGDATAASTPEDNHSTKLSDEKPKAVRRRAAASEAGRRQRSSVSESITGYCAEFANIIAAVSDQWVSEQVNGLYCAISEQLDLLVCTCVTGRLSLGIVCPDDACKFSVKTLTNSDTIAERESLWAKLTYVKIEAKLSVKEGDWWCWWFMMYRLCSVIFVNGNENKTGEKRDNN